MHTEMDLYINLNSNELICYFSNSEGEYKMNALLIEEKGEKRINKEMKTFHP